jgi:hypothetical protein
MARTLWEAVTAALQEWAKMVYSLEAPELVLEATLLKLLHHEFPTSPWHGPWAEGNSRGGSLS